jgi:UDP-4-amino-4,6-dideoxy-N-acetyl-beta-L-altrosamine transaminase
VIPYGRHDIQDDDIAAVLEVLQSDFLTQGPVVPQFEEVVSKHCGVDYAIAANSATSALHIAFMALGVGAGDIVWTSTNTFVASSNAALYCGANVDFVDIDPKSYNMSINALTEKLELAQKCGQSPKVVVPVHLAGQPCDMQAIFMLAEKYGFRVVEDASHAIGGQYRGANIGNCAYSDITVFSFHPVKIVTTAEGGMAVTNQADLAEKMRLFRNHGITRDPALMKNGKGKPWYYEQVTLGYNYRMTDLQAALGVSQMKRLCSYITRRHEIANLYNQELKNLPIILPAQADFSYSAYHLYIIRLDLDAIVPLSQADVFQTLLDHKIFVQLHYIPVHTQPYYTAMGFNWGDFPNAESHSRSAVSIPIYPTLTDEAQSTVIGVLRKVLG